MRVFNGSTRFEVLVSPKISDYQFLVSMLCLWGSKAGAKNGFVTDDATLALSL